MTFYLRRAAFASAAIAFVSIGIPASMPAADDSEVPKSWRISCFAYRDINRNGIYDMADRPYAGLRVELERPNGSTVSGFSNIGGFANFEMERDGSSKPHIYEPGTYGVKAVLPLGWESFSDGVRQEIIIDSQENAGSGMVASKPCDHIGLSPILTISGLLTGVEDAEVEDISITAQHADGEELDIAVNDFGQFSFPARKGEWRIEVTDRASGKTVLRHTRVGDYAVVLSAIDVRGSDASPLPSPVTVIDMDRLTTSDTLYEIPSGYEDLDWKYWISTHQRFYEGAGYVNATTSGEFFAYNSSGLPATISSRKPFDLVGVNVTAAWPRGEREYVRTQAWRGDRLVYEDRFVVTTAGPVYFDADYLGVDKVVFSHGNYERIAIDDLEVRK